CRRAGRRRVRRRFATGLNFVVPNSSLTPRCHACPPLTRYGRMPVEGAHMTEPPADLQRLVELHQRKRQLEAELKEVNNEITILDEQLRQNLFEPNGYSSLRLNGATIS